MPGDEFRVTETEPTTREKAVANAARLLTMAEIETNLPLMERLEGLADSWIAIAGLLTSQGDQ